MSSHADASPFLCYCWQSESDGQLPSGRSCSYKSFLWDPSDAAKTNGNNTVSLKVVPAYFKKSVKGSGFTSRIKNLAVLVLLQVFFSRDTGVMFIPAAEKINVTI